MMALPCESTGYLTHLHSLAALDTLMYEEGQVFYLKHDRRNFTWEDRDLSLQIFGATIIDKNCHSDIRDLHVRIFYLLKIKTSAV